MEHDVINNSVYYFIDSGKVYYHPNLWKRIESLDEDKQLKAITTSKNHAEIIMQNAKESGRKVLDGEMYWLFDPGFWLRMTTDIKEKCLSKEPIMEVLDKIEKVDVNQDECKS